VWCVRTLSSTSSYLGLAGSPGGTAFSGMREPTLLMGAVALPGRAPPPRGAGATNDGVLSSTGVRRRTMEVVAPAADPPVVSSRPVALSTRSVVGVTDAPAWVHGAASATSGGIAFPTGAVVFITSETGSVVFVTSGIVLVTGAVVFTASGIVLVTEAVALAASGITLVTGAVVLVTGRTTLATGAVALVTVGLSLTTGRITLVTGAVVLLIWAAPSVTGSRGSGREGLVLVRVGVTGSLLPRETGVGGVAEVGACSGASCPAVPVGAAARWVVTLEAPTAWETPAAAVVSGIAALAVAPPTSNRESSAPSPPASHLLVESPSEKLQLCLCEQCAMGRDNEL
jgi:hypothetical protein